MKIGKLFKHIYYVNIWNTQNMQECTKYICISVSCLWKVYSSLASNTNIPSSNKMSGERTIFHLKNIEVVDSCQKAQNVYFIYYIVHTEANVIHQIKVEKKN